MLQATRWSRDQVRALAPDATSFTTAQRLAGKDPAWTGAGCDGDGVWGECAGSGAKTYQICVDVAAPAYRCSCPSRKFPCKHALALLVRWADGAVPQTSAPDWMRQWTEARQARTQRAAQRSAPTTPQAQRAAQRRAEQRRDRMAAGAADLRQWLHDQVRQGLADWDQAGHRRVEQVAARLVDAQAPGLASTVRALGTLPSTGTGWERRLLSEVALTDLLAHAAQRMPDLPESLAATVRARVGQPPTAEQVLAVPGVRDRWLVTGRRDEPDDRLSVRRVWLRGLTGGRDGLVLSFAAPGQALPADLIPGTVVDADLSFHPSTAPLRALVGQRHAAPVPAADVHGDSVAQAVERVGAAVAADPWTSRWPVLVHATVVPGEPWHLVDDAGDALPCAPGVQTWPLVSAGGGRPLTVAAEWTPAGLRPLAAHTTEGMVAA